MKKLLLIIAIGLFCDACGVKGEPEYKSQTNYNKNIYLVI